MWCILFTDAVGQIGTSIPTSTSSTLMSGKLLLQKNICYTSRYDWPITFISIINIHERDRYRYTYIHRFPIQSLVLMHLAATLSVCQRHQTKCSGSEECFVARQSWIPTIISRLLPNFCCMQNATKSCMGRKEPGDEAKRYLQCHVTACTGNGECLLLDRDGCSFMEALKKLLTLQTDSALPMGTLC